MKENNVLLQSNLLGLFFKGQLKRGLRTFSKIDLANKLDVKMYFIQFITRILLVIKRC